MTTCEFTVDGAMKSLNLINKHPEIFNSGKDELIKKFLDHFTKYTELINKSKKNGLEELVKKIKSDFKTTEENFDKLEISNWSENYFKYCNDKNDNDVYVYPRNDGIEKIVLPYKYNVNCIKLENADLDSLKIVNRNNHMMISGNSKNDKFESGKDLSFKILVIYNKHKKKWIVLPYKMVSTPSDDVNCKAFALSATTDDLNRQYNVWNKGLEENKGKVGILNHKFLNEHYKTLPNLFGEEKSKHLLDTAHEILQDSKSTNVMNDDVDPDSKSKPKSAPKSNGKKSKSVVDGGGLTKKKSAKKNKSSKKKSAKKKSAKKKSTKKNKSYKKK